MPKRPARKRPRRQAAKPKVPTTMTRAEYARHRRVSRAAVTKAVRSRRIPVGADGRIDVAAADRAWATNTDPSRPGTGLPVEAAVPADPESGAASSSASAPDAAGMPEDMTFVKAKTLREWEAAQRLKRERLIDERRLLDGEEYYDVAYNAIRKARDLMQTLADRLAPQLVGLTDQARIHELITGEHERLREELVNAVTAGEDDSESTSPEDPGPGEREAS